MRAILFAVMFTLTGLLFLPVPAQAQQPAGSFEPAPCMFEIPIFNFTPPEQRSPAQRERLAVSDHAVALLKEADTVIVTVPVYNFSLPSTLKAWIDHVCRAGVTFRYTENGPRGLLADRPVYLVMTSGGVPFGSPMDFASGYLKQVLNFIGIEDVRLVGAEGVASDAGAAQQAALNTLDDWLPVPVTRVA